VIPRRKGGEEIFCGVRAHSQLKLLATGGDLWAKVYVQLAEWKRQQSKRKFFDAADRQTGRRKRNMRINRRGS